MDQFEYYSLTEDYYTFLKKFDVCITDFEKDNISSNNINADLTKIKEHVNAMHKIIFAEIAKNGLSNNFLIDLKHQINSFQHDN